MTGSHDGIDALVVRTKDLSLVSHRASYSLSLWRSFHHSFLNNAPDHFYRVITESEYLKPNWTEKVDLFDHMGLKEEVLRGIYGYGFTKPSPIQQKGILPIIQGHDTIAQVSSTPRINSFIFATPFAPTTI